MNYFEKTGNHISIGFLFLILTLSFIPTTLAQGFLSTQGKAIVSENGDSILFRGMGLGGWMLQEGYMLQTSEFANAQYQIKEHITDLIGEEQTNQFYAKWLENHVTKQDIDSLEAWGFNMVRLPMHYNLFTLPIEEEPVEGQQTWLETGFILTDSLISWCKANQMYVILDLHAAPGGQGMDQGISDYNPEKPSLWESKANRDKTVALWKRLAERYSDEVWVAGYDLLNEPNWEMNGNIPLRDLYFEITDSIRSVDTNHIIFIEGNWFANDFTALTPPWDDNMVYSPHKYWSINDKASIQWVLNIRDNFNVPLFFGESGENSNVWFRDAIFLFEDEGIGWAWWPLKKVESISGPLSVIKTENYNSLLEYWKGNGTKPTEEFAYSTLMDLTEKLKTENCIFQKDVIDAMFRQVYSTKTKAYKTHNLPGIVYATDYDMGQIGVAYYDTEAANYNVSTGQYTSWNTGWTLRNDGVDIEICNDLINSNGYNVGWTAKGEWIQYDVKINKSAQYDVVLRVASESGGGKLHFKVGDADVSDPYPVPRTGSWTQWRDMTVPGIVLDTADAKISLFIDEEGFNISSMEFIEMGASTAVSTVLLNAKTVDTHTIQLDINKNIQNPLDDTSVFKIYANGVSIDIEDAYTDPENSRIIYLQSVQTLRFDQSLQVSYISGQIESTDGTSLNYFELEPVINTLDVLHSIPGKIEAEDFVYNEGIQLESTTDNGGGQNIAFLDRNDFCDYLVEVKTAGDYILQYRFASEQSTGSCRLVLIDENGIEQEIDRTNFNSTGAWQNWTIKEKEVSLNEGVYRMRFDILNGPFNVNWFNFIALDPLEEEFPLGVVVGPNPSSGIFTITAGFSVPHDVKWDVYDLKGSKILNGNQGYSKGLKFQIDLREAASGYYFLNIYLENETSYNFNLIKM